MNELLNHLGPLRFFIPLFLACNAISVVTLVLCRFTGPIDALSSPNFFAPIILAIGMAILVFYSTTFWATWIIYAILWGLSAALSFLALESCLEDKTGLGATMASGFVGLMCFSGAAMTKGVVVIFNNVFG